MAFGLAFVAGLAGLPGCGSSGSVHVADPAVATKTLIDENVQPRHSKNKRMQRLIAEEQREIAQHPKVR